MNEPTVPLEQWQGCTEQSVAVLREETLLGLAALLNYEQPPWRAGEAPPLAHWLTFLPRSPAQDLGPDGHVERGGFPPPVKQARRMWAGSIVTFHAAVPLEVSLIKRSTIQSVAVKSGRSGELVFVTLHHEIFAAGMPVVTELQDLVYRRVGPSTADRAATAATAPVGAPTPPTSSLSSSSASPTTFAVASTGHNKVRRLTPSTIDLFRFSALTFNSHRIHYDRDYARDVEGYPDVVVHGPYIATLLMDLFLRHRPGARPTQFRFRAQSPLFVGRSLELRLVDAGGVTHLQALDDNAQVAVTAMLSSENL